MTNDDMPTRALTERQIEILTHVARGGSNRQIGQMLGISERTVRNHLRSISAKLSTSDRTRAVVIAIERGWIAIPIEPDERSPESSVPTTLQESRAPGAG